MQSEPRHKKPPLDAEGLERLALRYVERYATTRSKLRDYLARKLRERGWEDEDRAETRIEALVARMDALGYVNDALFAKSRSASLARRGYGAQRVQLALRAAGVEEADSFEARQMAKDSAWQSAIRFAQRKRIGPYAQDELPREKKQKAFMAMLRAGHPADISRRLVEMAPGASFPEDESKFP